MCQVLFYMFHLGIQAALYVCSNIIPIFQMRLLRHRFRDFLKVTEQRVVHLGFKST